MAIRSEECLEGILAEPYQIDEKVAISRRKALDRVLVDAHSVRTWPGGKVTEPSLERIVPSGLATGSTLGYDGRQPAMLGTVIPASGGRRNCLMLESSERLVVVCDVK
jgi:hypothetical protein